MIRNLESSNRAHAVRILIYSPHDSVVDAVTRAVNHGVYLTRAATDGPAAAAIIREWDVQLAIIDIGGGVGRG